jgi:hypothetical protein
MIWSWFLLALIIACFTVHLLGHSGCGARNHKSRVQANPADTNGSKNIDGGLGDVHGALTGKDGTFTHTNER